MKSLKIFGIKSSKYAKCGQDNLRIVIKAAASKNFSSG